MTSFPVTRGLVNSCRRPWRSIVGQHMAYSSKCKATKRIKKPSCGTKGENSKCTGGLRFPCGKPEAQVAAPKQLKKKPKFESMWANPFCDQSAGPCPISARFDDLYYQESDKAKRRYWQTWVSCPKLKLKKKKLCCYEQAQLPPIKRRQVNVCKAKEQVAKSCKLGGSEKEGCPCLNRVCSRGCGRKPPNCKPATIPTICNRTVAPYPAFSECLRLKSGEKPVSECLCWQKPLICELWLEFRKRNLMKQR